MRKALRLIFALAVLVAAGACAKRDPLVVKTQAGLVRGFYEDGMLSFRSIPYMKAERFMTVSRRMTAASSGTAPSILKREL